MKLNKIWVIATLIMYILLSGCSSEPIYYTKSEVQEYVKDIFDEDFKLVDELNYSDNSDEANLMYEYIFQDENGFKFSVYTSTYHPSFDATETSFYEKHIEDNYIQEKARFHQKELIKILEECQVSYEFNEGYTRFFAEDITDFKAIAKAIVNIDQLFNFSYEYQDFKEGKIHNAYDFIIYLKPNLIDDNEWVNKSEYRIIQLVCSHDSKIRLENNSLYEKIERALVYKIRRTTNEYPSSYQVSDEILYKYPAEFITLININLEYEYVFSCDEDTNIYWIYNLDPCFDSEKMYNYNETGTFKDLITYLGGSYEVDGWDATWTIGQDIWNAKNIVDKDDTYQDFIIKKNGNEIELSNPEERSNGTVSGRAFTLEDLEKMLGIDLIVDQKEATVKIVKKECIKLR